MEVLDKMAERVIEAMRGYVKRNLDVIVKRIEAVEARQPENGKDGRDGLNGKDGADGIDGKDGAPGVQGPQGEPGRNGEPGQKGEKGEKGEPGVNGKDGAPGERGPQGERGADGKDGRDGIDGKDGADGLNGKDGAPGIDGKDGINGKDGTSITVDDVRPMLETAISKWELDFERRASETLQKAIDRIPVPKDGRDGLNGKDGRDGVDGVAGRDGINGKDGADGINGKDGRDGFGFDDLSFEYDGERTIALKFVRGDDVKRFEAKIPVMIERGVYVYQKDYSAGDYVTYGGAGFVAKRDTTSTPPGEDWRLVHKGGRFNK